MDQNFSDDEMRAFLMITAERSDLDLWTRSVAEMSGPRQTFVLIWELEAEVNNGGFQQYFHNSSGEGAGHCEKALKAIGAEATAALLARAIDIFGSDTAWQDDYARQTRADCLGSTELEALDLLDQAFYQYEDDLAGLLFTYVAKHIGDFPSQ